MGVKCNAKDCGGLIKGKGSVIYRDLWVELGLVIVSSEKSDRGL